MKKNSQSGEAGVPELISLRAPLGDVLGILPGSGSVFSNFGIDCVLSAGEPFEEICRRLRLEPTTALRILSAVSGTVSESSAAVPIELMGLSELCDHLQATHHGPLQTELSRLDLMLAGIEEASEPPPAVSGIRERFGRFREKLSAHLREEGEVLFPLIRQLDDPKVARTGVLDLLRVPLLKMREEHDEVDEELAVLELMAAAGGLDFAEFRARLQCLEEMMHGQIYQENQILFRRVLALVS